MGAPRIGSPRSDVARLTNALFAWSRHHTVGGTQRIGSLSQLLVTAAPFSTSAGLATAGKLSLWVFALDDVADTGAMGIEQLAFLAASSQSLAKGEPADPLLLRTADPSVQVILSLISTLREIRDETAKGPLFDALQEHWSRALLELLQGMRQEKLWSAAFQELGPDELPAFEEYLVIASATISGALYAYTILSFLEDRSVCRHLPWLAGMVTIAGRCIRLANDLRTQAREAREGKINSLTIVAYRLSDAGNPTPSCWQSAANQVRGALNSSLADLQRLRRQSATDSGQAEAAITNIAEIACAFYAQGDFPVRRRQADSLRRSPEVSPGTAAALHPAVLSLRRWRVP